jgi:hypothetical protein
MDAGDERVLRFWRNMVESGSRFDDAEVFCYAV